MSAISPRFPLLAIDDVTVRYPNAGQAAVLERFSLTLEAAAFLAVVGPSGCGKSTLLHTIAGFLQPARGSVRLKGELVEEPGLEIGFVGQRYALFPWLTVENNIGFGLRSQKQSEPDVHRRVDGLLDIVGLKAYRRYYPEQLSGGMQQRAALARAMAPNPSLLLLDEPFSALDTETRRKMRDLLLRLWGGRETTIIFVTHDIEEALLLADSTLILTTSGERSDLVDVPFQRPRPSALEHTVEFRELHDRIASKFVQFHQPADH